MGNALGDDFTDQGALAGMKGTTPLTDLSADFKDRLLDASTPTSADYNYAGESYDAVVLIALAAQAAGTNDANVFAPYVNGLTFGGDKCTDYASCLEILSGRRQRRLRRRLRPARLHRRRSSPLRPASVCCSSARTTRSTTRRPSSSSPATRPTPPPTRARLRSPTGRPPAARWSSARCCR